MKTKELLEKQDLTKEEKIAHLKKLGLWREFQNELKKCNGDLTYLLTLQYVLKSRSTWRSFLFGSLVFYKTSRGHEFWKYVANNGKKPLK